MNWLPQMFSLDLEEQMVDVKLIEIANEFTIDITLLNKEELQSIRDAIKVFFASFKTIEDWDSWESFNFNTERILVTEIVRILWDVNMRIMRQECKLKVINCI